jgi:hypothetical protein
MAGLVPAIHVFLQARKTWMPGMKPGMTWRGESDVYCNGTFASLMIFL